MKICKNSFAILFLVALLASCSKEVENEDYLQNETNTVANSVVGGGDDEGEVECFEFVYPITVLGLDGSETEVNSEVELEAFFDEVEENGSDDDDLSLQFPFDVILADSTNQTISDEMAFDELLLSCEDEDEEDHEGEDDEEDGEDEDEGDDEDEDDGDDGDEDEEDCDDEEDFDLCFDLVYPITVLLPDGSEVVLNNDMELEEAYDAYEETDLNADELPTIQFPIEVTLEDGTTQTINSTEEIEVLIASCE